MSKIVCDKPENFSSDQYKLVAVQVYNPETGFMIPDLVHLKVPYILMKEFKVCDVRIKKSKEEKAEKRRAYRKDYMKKPKTIAKIAARLADPSVAKKRKEYSKDPEVMERKRKSAKKQRAMGRLLKQEKPEVYRALLEKVDKQLSASSASDAASNF